MLKRSNLRLIFFLPLLFLFTLTLTAQVEWARNYGGSGEDVATSIQQTSEGGYIVAGYTTSQDIGNNYGLTDFWVLKLNENGDSLWQRNYGGYADDYAFSIQCTSDGGYIVAGSNYSLDSLNNVGNHWILKLSENGDSLWQKNYGTFQGVANSIIQTNDGGYITAGYGGGDFLILKLDEVGDSVWVKFYGTNLNDVAYSVQQTVDGEYVVAGTIWGAGGDVEGNSYGIFDYWVIKLDEEGNLVWEKNYGGSEHDWAYSIQHTNEGGYVVAGKSSSNDSIVGGNYGSDDFWIVKLDDEGSLVWEENYGGSSSDVPTSVHQTTDGGYIIAGFSYSSDFQVGENNGNKDYWVVKVNSTGHLLWEENLGGSNAEEANAIQETSDGGYIVAGYSQSSDFDVEGNYGDSDFWIVKLAPEDCRMSDSLALVEFYNAMNGPEWTVSWDLE